MIRNYDKPTTRTSGSLTLTTVLVGTKRLQRLRAQHPHPSPYDADLTGAGFVSTGGKVASQASCLDLGGFGAGAGAGGADVRAGGDRVGGGKSGEGGPGRANASQLHQ